MLERVLESTTGFVEAGECAPGVRCCELDTYLPESAVLCGRECCVEALFCTSGDIRTEAGKCSNRQILLMAGGREHVFRFASSRLKGVLICVDLSGEDGLCEMFAPGEDVRALSEDFLAGKGGVYIYGQSAWSEAVFSALRNLPAGDRGRYCAMKFAELLYLLTRRGESGGRTGKPRYRDPYLVETVRRIHDYMLSNIGEKLTIDELSSRFRIAPTSFKECFRELYGESVHAYLLNRRMERACELLSATNLPVFRIAESVGYGSASQFGVEFKRRYSLSPLVYRRTQREKNV